MFYVVIYQIIGAVIALRLYGFMSLQVCMNQSLEEIRTIKHTKSLYNKGYLLAVT